MTKISKIYMRSLSILLAACVFLTACGSEKEEKKEEPIEPSSTISQDDDYQENTAPTEISLVEQEDSKEEEIINYFENLRKEFYDFANSDDVDELKSNVKNAIIDGIDFIFYGKEIKGITFEELSDDAKAEIKRIIAEMDIIIENRIPGYKEELKSSFGRFGDAAKENISNIDTALEEALGPSYDDIKELVGATGDVIGNAAEITGELIEHGAESGFTFIKEWYEEKTGKR